MRSLYDAVKANTSIEAASASATDGAANNGTAIDTMGYSTGVLRARVALMAGSPTTSTTVVTLQESDSSTALFADALDNTGVVIGGTVGKVAGDVVARIEGLGVNRKRYLRAVIKNTSTGGSGTSIALFAEILLGRGYTQPANTAVSNT